jgi:undecaprenyl-diphosphatase
MTLFQALILGLIQGLTEFLPISSSAHLVIAPYLFGWTLSPAESFIFDVLVQMGTLVAVVIYFWKDLKAISFAMWNGLISRTPGQTADSRLGWLIILATIPAIVFGMLIKDQVEAAFNSPVIAAIFLSVTAVLLVVAERIGRRVRELKDISWIDALWIGLFQALSVFPGISRSGSTIAGAMLRNSQRSSAARFSFLMSVPIMLAAGGLALVDLTNLAGLEQKLWIIMTGFCTSGVVGYFTIRWLIRYLSHHSLYGFAAYCAILSGLVLILSLTS